MDRTPQSSLPRQASIFKVLKAGGVRQIACVPDAGHSHAFHSGVADPDIESIVLTTEEEGVAAVSGDWPGGQRAALPMQSSGVGSCVDTKGFGIVQAFAVEVAEQSSDIARRANSRDGTTFAQVFIEASELPRALPLRGA